MLQTGAVPSINLPQNHSEKTKPSTTRSSCCSLFGGPDGEASKDRCEDSPGEDGDSGSAPIRSTVLCDPPCVRVIEAELLAVESLLADFMLDALRSHEKLNLSERLETLPSNIAPHIPSSGSSLKTIPLWDLVGTESELGPLVGVTNSLLHCLTQLVLRITENTIQCPLSARERIVLTLLKLQTDFDFEVLGMFFGVSKLVCCECFNSTIHLLARLLKPCILWPSREDNVMSMPECYNKCRDTRILLDSIDIPVDSPGCLKCLVQMHSHYKDGLICKLLVGVSPSGLITFLSKCYGGKASCERILKESDLVCKKMLEPFNDAVIVQKGICIDKLCEENNIRMYRPDPSLNAEIGVGREKLEKTISKLKAFKVLTRKLCWSLVPQLDDIMTVIVGLVNLSSPIISSDPFIAGKDCGC